MVTQCHVCRHPRRAEIEIGLANRVPIRVLGERFDVSPWSIQRHRKAHLSETAKAAILTAKRPSEIDLEALERTESEGLLANVLRQRARLQQLVESAMELGDVRAAAAVEGKITDNLSLAAKLLGQLVVKHEVKKASIVLSADYIALRGAIIRALEPHPQARIDVAKALHALEAEAAEEIKEAKAPALIEATP